MGKGGARLSSGPAPTLGGQNMKRTAADWRRIPVRDGVGIDVPDWPVGMKEPSQGEWEMWEDLWLHSAQALIWEEERLAATVAQYVRIFLLSTQGRFSAQHGTLAKQLREELLLSVASLRAAKIAIVGSEEADVLDSILATAANPAETPEDTPQGRNRLRSVKTA